MPSGSPLCFLLYSQFFFSEDSPASESPKIRNCSCGDQQAHPAVLYNLLQPTTVADHYSKTRVRNAGGPVK
jgi:hypothetical protein